MVEKLHEYEGFVGRLHGIRNSFKEKYDLWKEQNQCGFKQYLRNFLFASKDSQQDFQDYSHIYRRKTTKELIRVSCAVMGIEFSYAAETAFVSPTLLKIGVEHKHMTLVWALSPLIGFFLTPILGSLSDRCPLKIGRRRPFIFFMSLGVFLGLLLVPNGEDMGYAMGDPKPENGTFRGISAHRTSGAVKNTENDVVNNNSHPWGIFFTILGTVLLDFDADACQSPSRAYLLDVTLPEDHARGLSTFTVMAGLGGFFGYSLGGINWDATAIGVLLGGHVKAVFSLITIIFVICVTYTITSFKEMPLHLLEMKGNVFLKRETMEMKTQSFEDESANIDTNPNISYGSVNTDSFQQSVVSEYTKMGIDPDQENENREYLEQRPSIIPSPDASLMIYLQSIIYMPHSIRMLCLTNLFCWMAHVCYSLYFTDFVGEAVFDGNPTAPDGTMSRQLYEEGVRFGCWGMSMYSLSCACYSMVIEKIIASFGAKKAYVGGLLVYSSGMFLMAVTKHKVGVILFSWTAGVMYSTLFTMPYLLIAHYHAKGTFETKSDGEAKICGQIRGLGTDVAIVSSMVFLAQFILSICMGNIVAWSGTTTAVVSVASTLAFCGAISATQVMYLDL